MKTMKGDRLTWMVILMAVLGVTGMTVSAQDTASCPASVLLASSRAGVVCGDIEHNLACYGSGQISAGFFSDVSDAAFAQPGDTMSTANIRVLRVGAPTEGQSEWSIMNVQFSETIGTQQGRNVSILAFGDVEIENLVPPIPELSVVTNGALNIRALPHADAEIVAKVGLRASVITNGRTADNQWLRVFSPEDGTIGWASMQVIAPESDIASLTLVDETTPFLQPMRVFHLQTGIDDAPCPGAPQSGILIQTPNTVTPVEIQINGAIVRLAGTAFVQAQANTMTVNLLDGFATIEASGETGYVPAGARIQVMAESAPSAAEPYDAGDLDALPINNLAYRLRVPAPLAQDNIDSQVAAWNNPVITPTVDVAAIQNSRCVRTTRYATSLRAGPGDFYEVVYEVAAGRRIYPVLTSVDADGAVWWQLRQSSWIKAAAVETEGSCTEVPAADYVTPPSSNYLSLETCTTSNGPLRVGQWVEIDFVPPAFATLEEAQMAVQVDPGQVTIDDRRLRVYASRPIQIGQKPDERYLRTFSTSWQATAGTHRIVGKRLSYILICNVTVPLG